MEMAALVSFEEGLTKEQVSAGKPSGRRFCGWECAGREPRGGSPLPTLCMPEKRRRDGLMRLAEDKADWVVGFEDEC
jgi:hypothetical protein